MAKKEESKSFLGELSRRRLNRREFLGLGLSVIGLGIGAAFLGGRKSGVNQAPDFKYHVYLPLVVKGSSLDGPPIIKGLTYGPYREGQDPDWGPYPSDDQIKEDLGILTAVVGNIRTYGSDHNLENIPRFILESGSSIKVNAGC